MLKWFNKKKKTSKDLIENVLNEAEKLNAFDEPEEAPEGWGSEPVLEEVQEQTEEGTGEKEFLMEWKKENGNKNKKNGSVGI